MLAKGTGVDGPRFDAMTRRLAGRWSRRTAIGRGGVGLAALLGGMAGFGGRGEVAARQPAGARFVIVRTYQPSGSLVDLQQALSQGYAPLLAQQPGFVEYLVFGNGSLVVSVTVFEDQQSEETAATQVADWVSQNLAPLLPSPGETLSGTTIAQVANPAAYCPAPPADPTAVPVAPTAPPVVPPTQAPPAPPTATAAPGEPTPTPLPICSDPAEPGRGCPCQIGTLNPCGADTLVCCPNAANQPPGGPGTCVPDRLGCDPTGTTPTPAPTRLPVCTDPARPGVGCACSTGTENPCGDTTLLCCADDADGPPGGPGTCTPSSIGCQPLGPTATPDPTPPCSGQGCRCNGGVQGACDDALICCPDNPGLPGGPGRCVPGDQCNPPEDCTSEGCTCHTGVEGACDGGLVCCADDSSQPGGPGRCEAEQVCFANQCQATTNPCPSSCTAGANCTDCCSGYCGADGFCGAARCGDQGCECTTGTENPCNNGLVCCPNTSGVAGGPGTCVAASACDAGDDSADTGDAAGTIDDGGSADDGGTDASGSADAGGSADAATATDADDGAIDAGGSADDPAGETGNPATGGNAADAGDDGASDAGDAGDASGGSTDDTGAIDPTPVE